MYYQRLIRFDIVTLLVQLRLLLFLLLVYYFITVKEDLIYNLSLNKKFMQL